LSCRFDYDRRTCDHLTDQDLEAALKAIEGDEQVNRSYEVNNYLYKDTPSSTDQCYDVNETELLHNL